MAGAARQVEGGMPSLGHGLELEPPEGRQVECGHGRGQALRPGQGHLDGKLHVGHGELGDGRVIHALDQRVDDGLRMDDDVERVVGHAEQRVRLDELEALVEQEGRVDGDAIAHAPHRVGQDVRGRRVGPVGAPAQRAARGGEDQAGDRPPGSESGQALEQPGVLAVDGQDGRAGGTGTRSHELAGEDQALLVGERERRSRLDRAERRGKPGRTGHGLEQDVERTGRRLLEARRTDPDACRVEVGEREELGARGVVGHDDDPRGELLHLGGEDPHVASGGQRLDDEAIGMRAGDGEPAQADGAGRAEHADPAREGATLPGEGAARGRRGIERVGGGGAGIHAQTDRKTIILR